MKERHGNYYWQHPRKVLQEPDREPPPSAVMLMHRHVVAQLCCSCNCRKDCVGFDCEACVRRVVSNEAQQNGGKRWGWGPDHPEPHKCLQFWIQCSSSYRWSYIPRPTTRWEKSWRRAKIVIMLFSYIYLPFTWLTDKGSCWEILRCMRQSAWGTANSTLSTHCISQ